MKKAWTALVLTVTLSLGLAAPAAAARFFDVPASYWGYSSIEYVAQQGLFSGTSQTTFSPEATMTRSMLTQVLYSYAGKPAVSGSVAGSTDYVDIPRGAYYEDAVLWALEEDIFPVWFVDDPNGAPASRFQPDRVVNRAEFSQMLFAFSQQVMEQTYQTNAGTLQGYVQNSSTCQFSDMTLQALRTALPELSRYAGSSQMLYSVLDTMVGWAYARGILSGTGSSTMSPALAVTRAQVATMLAQYHRRYGELSQPDYALKLSSLPSELTVGDREVLTASGQSGASYTCVSSASGVVRVTELGSSRWQLDAVGAGRATITVTDSNGKTARVTVEVTQSSQVPDPGEDDVVAEVIRLVNVERAKQGLSALKTNDAITKAAQTRADELLQLFDHTRPDGRSCFTALGEAGVSYRAAGENIAMGYPTPEAVVNGWMNSPGHRANILNRSFTTIGVGYNSQRNCWVQMFVG